jgi:hypothetical protein
MATRAHATAEPAAAAASFSPSPLRSANRPHNVEVGSF